MAQTDPQQRAAIRTAIQEICRDFPGAYWRELEARGGYPDKFVHTLTEQGWLSVLIPVEYGGGGLGTADAGLILEEIHRSGANANACHAQMYTMGALLRHGSDFQKQKYLPQIAAGELRLQAFGITEPDAGSDTKQIKTTAVREGDFYRVNGQKTFISRVENSDLMLLLVRVAAGRGGSAEATGTALLLVDLRQAGDSVESRRIPMMFNHHTYQVFLSDLLVPVENLVGEEGAGFKSLLDGLNAERILIASEAIGDGRFFLEKASAYATGRIVFDRPVGANQGVQFPLAHACASVEAASLMRDKAAELFDADQPSGAAANMAKLLASEASWEAANAAVAACGGLSFATEFDLERKFRETKLLQIAPVSNNLVLAYLAQRILGLPKSY